MCGVFVMVKRLWVVMALAAVSSGCGPAPWSPQAIEKLYADQSGISAPVAACVARELPKRVSEQEYQQHQLQAIAEGKRSPAYAALLQDVGNACETQLAAALPSVYSPGGSDSVKTAFTKALRSQLAARGIDQSRIECMIGRLDANLTSADISSASTPEGKAKIEQASEAATKACL